MTDLTNIPELIHTVLTAEAALILGVAIGLVLEAIHESFRHD